MTENKTRYRISDKERGRPPRKYADAMEVYTIRLRVRTAARLRKMGLDRVRKILDALTD